MRAAFLLLLFAPAWAQLPGENVDFETVKAKSGMGIGKKSARARMAAGYEVIFGTNDIENLEQIYLAAKAVRDKADNAEVWTNIPKMERAYKKDKDAMMADPFLNQVITANARLKSAMLDEDLLQRRAHFHKLNDRFPYHVPIGWAIVDNELQLGNLEGARQFLNKVKTWEPEICLWPTLVLDAKIEKASGFIEKGMESLEKAAEFDFLLDNPAAQLLEAWQQEIEQAKNDPWALAEMGAESLLDKNLKSKDNEWTLAAFDYYMRKSDPLNMEKAFKVAMKDTGNYQRICQLINAHPNGRTFLGYTMEKFLKKMDKMAKSGAGWGDDFAFYYPIFSTLKYEEQEAQLRNFLEKNPNHPDAFKAYVQRMRISSREPEFAQKYAEQINRAECWYDLAYMYRTLADWDHFFQVVLLGLERFPNDPQFTKLATLVPLDLEEPLRARYGDLLTFLCFRAAQEKADRFNYFDAASYAEKMAQWYGKPEGWLLAGNFHYRNRPGEAALTLYQKIEPEYAGHAYFCDLIGDCYLAMDQTRDAIKYYKAALALDAKRSISQEKLDAAEKRLHQKVTEGVLGVVAVLGAAGGMSSGNVQVGIPYYGGHIYHPPTESLKEDNELGYGIEESQPLLANFYQYILDQESTWNNSGAKGLVHP